MKSDAKFVRRAVVVRHALQLLTDLGAIFGVLVQVGNREFDHLPIAGSRIDGPTWEPSQPSSIFSILDEILCIQ